MIKVPIIDDEEVVRNGLKKYISWELYCVSFFLYKQELLIPIQLLTVTFRDIHFYNQTICLQLPVKDDLPNRTDTITIPEENTKMVYLADFVMDEIQLQKERLEACQKTAPATQDSPNSN